ncbi:MAG: hypothetical protein IPJ65_38550 [Archangiaceae bacterium]|nr:hypothetical protein [Archangiaceae bacterium]
MVRRPAALAGLSACLVLAACSRPGPGGLELTLRFFPASPSRCARVVATGEDGVTTRSSDPIARQSRDLHVGVYQSAELGEQVTLQAHGYASPDCSGPENDASNLLQQRFTRGKVENGLVLTLDGPGMNPGDAGVERCDDGVDGDGDTLVDCADADCAGKACGDAGVCRAMACTNDTVAEIDCANGADDDHDGHPDCEDDDCADRLCAGAPACRAAKCLAHACGAEVSCPAPDACQSGSGMCLGDGGCGYTERSGPCGDAGTCLSGRCVGGAFAFPTHNVPQELLDTDLNGAVLIDCDATLDTDSALWSGTCVTPPPKSFLVDPHHGAKVLRVVAARTLTVTTQGSLSVRGSLPLAFAVLGAATIAGVIDVSADGGTGGPGSLSLSACGAAAGSPATVGTSAGGGGAAHGGNGAKGGDAFTLAGSGGLAGARTSDATLVPLRGGCSGGVGAVPTAVLAAEGGGGGGALQLTVGGACLISGKLLANGAGGAGGPLGRGGGAGAGSGGGIVLEGPNLVLDGMARVLTNGGGGGQGGSATTAGKPGDPGATNDDTAARGGHGGPNPEGGDGQGKVTEAKSGDSSDDGDFAAGGAGAGLGRIVVYGSCSKVAGVKTAPDVGEMCKDL